MCPNPNPASNLILLRPTFHQALLERDFLCTGDRVYRRGPLTLTPRGRWLVLREEPGGPEPESRFPIGLGGLDLPGLWKWTGASPRHRVFEIPIWVADEDSTDDALGRDAAGNVFGKILDWATAARFRDVPAGWTAPDRALVEAWIPRGGLTVQARGFVRQGEMILSADRWALRLPILPILPRLPHLLPQPRREALHSLLVEAQRRWAMVRLGLSTEQGDPAPDPAAFSLIAEVDLTGAPHSESLFSAGLNVLRHVVAWLVETVDVLGDPDVMVGSLAVDGGNTAKPYERRVP